MSNLREAAEKFDAWMLKFVDSHRRLGHLTDNNKALVDFLYQDQGFNYVKNYTDLCNLARIVQDEKEYTITNPPCSPAAFSAAIEKISSRENVDGAMPVKPGLGGDMSIKPAPSADESAVNRSPKA